MTREEIKEAAKVMEAYANGKKVQYLNNDNEWIDCSKPIFNWHIDKYRIKPEPKYRPFKTQEECWNEMHKHPDFGWLKGFVTGEYRQLARISKCGTLSFNMSCNDSVDYSPEIMLRSYLFTDDTPFGVKDE